VSAAALVGAAAFVSAAALVGSLALASTAALASPGLFYKSKECLGQVFQESASPGTYSTQMA